MKSEVTIANSYLSHILYSDTINISKGEKSGQYFAYTKERYVFFLILLCIQIKLTYIKQISKYGLKNYV